MHCSWGILEQICFSTFPHCLFCRVSLVMEYYSVWHSLLVPAWHCFLETTSHNLSIAVLHSL